MSKEIKRLEDTLLFRLGIMAKENEELEQCIHRLMDDYNEVVCQLQKLEKRKDEDPARQTLGQMSQMRDLCDKLELENKQLKMYAKAVDSFIKDKELYMPKGIYCPYIQETFAVASTTCLECDSCLRVLDDCGVVCRKVLYGAKVKPCPHQRDKS